MLLHKHQEIQLSASLVGNGQQLSSFLKVISSLGPASALETLAIVSHFYKRHYRVVFIVTVF
jgi:hypothetical protein